MLGGFLTTDFSWRWAFIINVIVVPFAIVGAALFVREFAAPERRERIDVPGALLIASGMFMLVFGISEGGTYGWWRPLRPLVIGRLVGLADELSGRRGPGRVPPRRAPPLRVRARRTREGACRGDPLFEFSNLRRLGFRYGLATLVVLAMGQVAFLLVISVFLQDGLHLSALDAGLWLIPSGVFIVAGSQLGGRLTRVIGTTNVVRAGLALEAVGLGATAIVIGPDVTFLGLLGGFALFGIGIGFAGSQLTNVILSDVPPERSGAASGANSTVRMVGGSLGIAIMSSMLSVLTLSHARDGIAHARGLSSAVRHGALAQIQAAGVSFTPRRGASAADVVILRHTLASAIASASRLPLFVATGFVTLGLVISFLIPRVHIPAGPEPELDDLEREMELLGETVTVR